MVPGAGPVRVELLRFSSLEGKKVFWHSSAHVLGAALEAELGPGVVQLCDGPPLLPADGAGMGGGFFYEAHLAQGGLAAALAARDAAAAGSAPAAASVGGGTGLLPHVAPSRGGCSLGEGALPLLEGRMRALAKERAPFERLHVTREQATALFSGTWPLSASDAAAAAASAGGAALRESLDVLQRGFYGDSGSSGSAAAPPAAAAPPSPWKLELISRLPHDVPITLYRSGGFVDLCRGPHLPHTGYVRAAELYRVAGAQWAWTPPAARHAQAQAQRTGSAAVAVAAAQRGAAEAPPPGFPPREALLQRVYGIAFPSPVGLAEWKRGVEEGRRRDHRLIGRAQSLFFFHELSPGSAFFLPHGTRVYNRLVEVLRGEYRRRGYDEVISPLMYRRGLWATSGHLDAYAENMFTVTPGMAGTAGTAAAAAPAPAPAPTPAAAAGAGGKGAAAHGAPASAAAAASAAADAGEHEHSSCCSHGHDDDAAEEAESEEDEGLGLKPMNCPGHCLLFAQRAPSYRDLPLRLADFSSLHRNEARGALGGLTRLRRFQQDDAHIFCAPAQVPAEVAGCLAFIAAVYRLLGFQFRAKLSTRPDKYVGDVETWDRAEAALADSLRAFLAPAGSSGGSSSAGGAAGDSEGGAGAPLFETDVGGGAFYGPKIDVFVRDALGRQHQCATVQLDFNLPARFGLAYTDASGAPARPVMIHRAILGSVERMLGILIEHTGGRWPFWLSPRQVLVASVAERHEGYAREAAEALLTPPSPFPAPLPHAAAASDAPATDAGVGVGVLHPSAGGGSLHVDVDATARTIPKKVREAQVAQVNVIAVVGDAEAAARSLTLRFRDAATHAAFVTAAAEIGVALPAPAAAAAATGAGSPASDAAAAATAPAAAQARANAPAKPGKKAGGSTAAAAAASPAAGSAEDAGAGPAPPTLCVPLDDARRVMYAMHAWLRG